MPGLVATDQGPASLAASAYAKSVSTCRSLWVSIPPITTRLVADSGYTGYGLGILERQSSGVGNSIRHSMS
jgi:hypothetical protein